MENAVFVMILVILSAKVWPFLRRSKYCEHTWEEEHPAQSKQRHTMIAKTRQSQVWF